MSDIIFNDVSLLHSSLENSDEAKSAFENFILEIAAAIDDGIVQSVMRSQVGLLDAEICLSDGSTWSIGDWFDNKNIDRDVRQLILTLDNKVPIEAEYPLSADDEMVLMTHEYRVHDESGPLCFAFGFALHTESIVASIPSHELWKGNMLPGSILLNGVAVKRGVVNHLSQAGHSAEIRQILNEKAFSSIVGRLEFIDQKEQVFPYLRFSPEVNNQVKELSGRQILNLSLKLLKMNKTAQRWSEEKTNTPRYQFSWRGESEQTMNKKEYVKARTFKMPTGEDGVFESHLDFSASHRIHFIEDCTNKTFIIGYVGNHLPTVKYRH